MKILLVQLAIVLFSAASIAQNINLQQDTTVSNLYDSRGGSCALGDVDNDGDLDLIITGIDESNGPGRRTTLYSNDGMGNFTEIVDTGLSNSTEGGDIEFVDVDGDGDLDLMLTGRDGNPVYYAHFYFNDGAGNYTTDSNSSFEGTLGGDFDFEDIDNDGDLDVFMCGWDNNNTVYSKLYLNDGTGGFTEVASTPFDGGTSSTFFDMDNDNDMDIIITGRNNNGENNTSLYENNGLGNFSLVNNTPFEGVQNSNICAGDSDGDGDMDILLNGTEGQEPFENVCQLYLNDGSGVFSLETNTPFIGCAIGTVDFADFDNDNDLDVFVTGSIGGADVAAHIYENLGNNNFNLADSLVGVYLSTTAIDDIDGDNDLDMIVLGIANQSTTNVFKPRVYKNMFTELCGGAGTAGCTDPEADNFDVDADCDDGSCVIGGCSYSFALNYNPAATYDDGSCLEQINGCTDPTALNYDTAANNNDESCEYEVLGCTDCAATNYDSTATADDGSCIIASTCSGDFTGDGFVTVADLTEFLSVFGSVCP